MYSHYYYNFPTNRSTFPRSRRVPPRVITNTTSQTKSGFCTISTMKRRSSLLFKKTPSCLVASQAQSNDLSTISSIRTGSLTSYRGNLSPPIIIPLDVLLRKDDDGENLSVVTQSSACRCNRSRNWLFKKGRRSTKKNDNEADCNCKLERSQTCMVKDLHHHRESSLKRPPPTFTLSRFVSQFGMASLLSNKFKTDLPVYANDSTQTTTIPSSSSVLISSNHEGDDDLTNQSSEEDKLTKISSILDDLEMNDNVTSSCINIAKRTSSIGSTVECLHIDTFIIDTFKSESSSSS